MADFSRARASTGTVLAWAVAAGLLLVLGAAVGRLALAAAVAVLQVAVAASWHDLVRAPGARAGSLIGLGSGLLATGLLFATYEEGTAEPTQVGGLALVAAAGVGAAFVQQLLGGDAGPPRVAGLTATSGLVLVEVLGACWLAVRGSLDGSAMAVAGAAAVTVAVVLISLLGSAAWAVVLAVVGATGVGLLAGRVAPGSLANPQIASVACAAAVAGICGAQVRRLAGRSARTAPTTTGALPFVLAAPAAFLAARLLVG